MISLAIYIVVGKEAQAGEDRYTDPCSRKREGPDTQSEYKCVCVLAVVGVAMPIVKLNNRVA